MASKKILLTGFEPFGGRALNPSYEAVKLSEIHGHNVKKICLPVTWGGASKILLTETEKFDPDAVVMCGLAYGSECVRVERVGINLCGAIADNDGNFPCGGEPREKKIYDDGDDAYFSTFDYEAILGAMREKNIPSAYSFSAGTYICNLVLYSALYNDIKTGRKRKTGFIHLPYVREFEGADSKAIALETAVMAVETAVDNCF